jgi:hypothetical protein
MAGTYNLSIDQGSDWTKIFLWQDSHGTPVNLSGFTARMMIKVNASDSSSVVTLTTENTRIMLYADGHIVLSIAGTISEKVKPGSYVYDLRLTGPSYPNKILLRGSVTVIANVTRP